MQGLRRTEDPFEVKTVKISGISRQNKYCTNKLLIFQIQNWTSKRVYIAASNAPGQKKYNLSIGWQLWLLFRNSKIRSNFGHTESRVGLWKWKTQVGSFFNFFIFIFVSFFTFPFQLCLLNFDFCRGANTSFTPALPHFKQSRLYAHWTTDVWNFWKYTEKAWQVVT